MSKYSRKSIMFNFNFSIAAYKLVSLRKDNNLCVKYLQNFLLNETVFTAIDKICSPTTKKKQLKYYFSP